MALIEWLKTIEVFSCFKEDELEALVTVSHRKRFGFGETILSAGDVCQDLYVLQTGKVRILSAGAKEKSIGVCGAGDSFAEKSILDDSPLEISVRASSDTEVLCFPVAVIRQLLSGNENARSFITQYTALKFSGGLLARFLAIKESTLDREEYEDVVRNIGAKKIRSGKRILEQDTGSDCRLYIIRSGGVSLVRKEEGREFTVGKLGPGEVFGEQACLHHSVQPVSAVADEDTLVIIIPQATVHRILAGSASLKQALEERILFVERSLERQRKVAHWKSSAPLIASSKGAGLGDKVIKRFQLVEQAEEMDCGAACLAMVCKHHKINVSLGKLREMANVTTEGATMESLSRVGERLGFLVKGVRASFGTLKTFDMPFIAHWEGFHYVVVYGVGRNHVWLADPGMGFRKLSRGDFEKGWTGNCLLFAPTDALAATPSSPGAWSRFVSFLKPLKRILRDLLLAALIMQLLGLAGPIILQNILDRVIVHQNVYLLNMMIIGLAAAMVFSHLTEFLSAYLSNFMARKLDFSMISSFYRHVLAMPVDFFARRKTGDIVARFQENEKIRRFMTESSISTVLNAVMVSIYLVVLFRYHVALTFVLLGFLLPIVLLTLAATPRYKNYARKTFYAEAESESLLMETLSGAESVKAMASERAMRAKWEKKYIRALDIRFETEMFTSTVEVLSSLLKAAATLTVLWYGSRLVLGNQLSIGQMVAYNAIVGAIMTPLLGLVGVWDEFQETLVSMERLGDVLDLEPEQNERNMDAKIILPDIDGDITLSGVYFRYGGDSTGGEFILENLNLTIPEGATVAIVGASGSGKTTLAKLLVGLYRPTEGTISVCGYDMESLDLSYYRQHIGYVMQNNLLFAGTIAENIATGGANIDQKQVIRCAKLADAHGFIANLPLAYEQLVGERGIGLSGGQNQRICIARALYRNPKLLIFDEATSALDGESEYQIQTNLNEILRDRTAVIIAHRLSTVMDADRIFVLYQGKLAEQGNHAELLDKKGVYYQLFKSQLAGLENHL